MVTGGERRRPSSLILPPWLAGFGTSALSLFFGGKLSYVGISTYPRRVLLSLSALLQHFIRSEMNENSCILHGKKEVITATADGVATEIKGPTHAAIVPRIFDYEEAAPRIFDYKEKQHQTIMYPTHHLKIARLISILHISIGLLFWIWSITLWARGQYDSGIVLFLFPIATGLTGLRIVYLRGGHDQANNNHSNNNSVDPEAEVVTSTDQNQTSMKTDKKGCCRDCSNNQQHTLPTKCWFILLLLTHVLTTAVYAYAGARGMEDFDKSWGYQLYCQIAAVCWAVSGVIISVLACRFGDNL